MIDPARNEPCPCGSGKKYKQCCLRAVQDPTSFARGGSIIQEHLLGAGQLENPLYQLYMKEAETFRWFASLDAESLRTLLLSTWYSMFWNPMNVDESLLKFYGHVIDGPHVMRLLQTLRRRYAYCEMYAWAIPNKEAIDVLLEHSPLIEIGAGRGYWAALASSAGADIIAFDSDPPDKGGVNKWHRQPGMFFDVGRADLEVARVHPDRTLFLCWPPYDSDVALRTLRNYKGSTVIYVGDDGHGAGTPQFYTELATGFTLKQVVDIPRWPGVDDRFEVWQRSVVTPPTT